MEAFTVGLILTALYAMFSFFQHKEHADTLKEYEDSLARYKANAEELIDDNSKLRREKYKLEIENVKLKHELNMVKLVHETEDVSDSTASFSMSVEGVHEAFRKISKVMSGANE